MNARPLESVPIRLLAGVWSIFFASLSPAPAQAPVAAEVRKAEPAPQEAKVATANPVTGLALSGGLRPLDVVQVSVYGEPDLETRARLTEEGAATLPLIGSVGLRGQSLKEAAQKITELYRKDYLVNPVVSVVLLERSESKRAFRVTILGQVARPGVVDLSSDQGVPIVEVIGQAGGFTRAAKESDITVKRLVAGQENVFKVNGKEQAADRNAKPFLVLPGDIIQVKESWF